MTIILVLILIWFPTKNMIFSIFSLMFGTLIVPRFARLSGNARLHSHRFMQILLVVLVVCAGVMLFVYYFSTQLLLVLGSKYQNLESELFLYILCSCVNLFVGICFLLYSSKGWIMKPILSIPYNIVFLIVGLSIFNVSTLHNALFFSLFISVLQLLLHFGFAIFMLKKYSSDASK